MPAVRRIRRVGDAPHVHQLNEHLAACAADSFGHFVPADDLIIGVDSRRKQIALSIVGRLRTFRNDQCH